MNRDIVYRLQRFFMGTTRGRKHVKGITLKNVHFEEYLEFLKNLNRYPLEEWLKEDQCLYFMGVPVYRHWWL